MLCRPCLHSGEAPRPSIHDASVRLSSAARVRRLPGLVRVDRSGVGDDRVERLLHFFPQGVGLVGGESLAAEHDGRFEILFGDVDELQAELLRVPHPGRVIRSDQLTAAFHVLSRDEVRKADDAPAHAIARLGHGDVVPGARQLVRGREAAEPAADHDHSTSGRLRHRDEPVADQERRRRRERSLEHFTPRNPARFSMLAKELGVEVWHVCVFDVGRSVARSLGRSLGRSVARSFGRSVARSLVRLLGRPNDRPTERPTELTRS